MLTAKRPKLGAIFTDGLSQLSRVAASEASVLTSDQAKMEVLGTLDGVKKRLVESDASNGSQRQLVEDAISEKTVDSLTEAFQSKDAEAIKSAIKSTQESLDGLAAAMEEKSGP